MGRRVVWSRFLYSPTQIGVRARSHLPVFASHQRSAGALM
ncbi:hypothetical protein EYF80_058019 [Liparis tanakae]|uniref:Uncharacterized protein n=1 Tax=Liparis tanakae TaxID=230148 RepID=A0A4Z2ESR4_9TELE|nr:hypothetical protein EYF80_058019 [Liparis tanakae]